MRRLILWMFVIVLLVIFVNAQDEVMIIQGGEVDGLKGRVIDGLTDSPLDSVSVKSTVNGVTGMIPQRTGIDGRFEVLPSSGFVSTFNLEIIKFDYKTRNIDENFRGDINVAEVSDVRLFPKNSFRIDGRVSGDRGGVARIKVKIVPQESYTGPSFETETNSFGDFSLTGKFSSLPIAFNKYKWDVNVNDYEAYDDTIFIDLEKYTERDILLTRTSDDTGTGMASLGGFSGLPSTDCFRSSISPPLVSSDELKKEFDVGYLSINGECRDEGKRLTGFCQTSGGMDLTLQGYFGSCTWLGCFRGWENCDRYDSCECYTGDGRKRCSDNRCVTSTSPAPVAGDFEQQLRARGLLVGVSQNDLEKQFQSCTENEGCPIGFWCLNNKCILPDLGYASCIESDLGKNDKYEKSMLLSRDTSETKEDECLESGNVREYYCVGSDSSKEEVCENGCVDGACVEEESDISYIEATPAYIAKYGEDISEISEKIDRLLRDEFKPIEVDGIKIYLDTVEEIGKKSKKGKIGRMAYYSPDEGAIYVDPNFKMVSEFTGSEISFESILFHEMVHAEQKERELEVFLTLEDPWSKPFVSVSLACKENIVFKSPKYYWKDGTRDPKNGAFTPSQCENPKEYVAYPAQIAKYYPAFFKRAIDGEFDSKELYEQSLNLLKDNNWITQEDYDGVINYVPGSGKGDVCSEMEGEAKITCLIDNIKDSDLSQNEKLVSIKELSDIAYSLEEVSEDHALASAIVPLGNLLEDGLDVVFKNETLTALDNILRDMPSDFIKSEKHPVYDLFKDLSRSVVKELREDNYDSTLYTELRVLTDLVYSFDNTITYKSPISIYTIMASDLTLEKIIEKKQEIEGRFGSEYYGAVASRALLYLSNLMGHSLPRDIYYYNLIEKHFLIPFESVYNPEWDIEKKKPAVYFCLNAIRFVKHDAERFRDDFLIWNCASKLFDVLKDENADTRIKQLSIKGLKRLFGMESSNRKIGDRQVLRDLAEPMKLRFFTESDESIRKQMIPLLGFFGSKSDYVDGENLLTLLRNNPLLDYEDLKDIHDKTFPVNRFVIYSVKGFNQIHDRLVELHPEITLENERFSIALATLRYLEGDVSRIDDGIEFILEKRSDFSDTELINKDTHLILITHEEKYGKDQHYRFDNDKIVDFAERVGVEDIPEKNLKGPGDKSNFLDLIKESENEENVLIWVDGHGGPDNFWLSEGQYIPMQTGGYQLRDNDVKISFEELGDVLLERGRNNVDQVKIFIGACFSYDFTKKLVTYLRDNGALSFPTIITITNKDSVGSSCIFEQNRFSDSCLLNSFNTVYGGRADEPFMGEYALAAEELMFDLQDNGFFLGGEKFIEVGLGEPVDGEEQTGAAEGEINYVQIAEDALCDELEDDDLSYVNVESESFIDDQDEEYIERIPLVKVMGSVVRNLFTGRATEEKLAGLCRVPTGSDTTYKSYAKGLFENLRKEGGGSVTFEDIEQVLAYIKENKKGWNVGKLRGGLYSQLYLDLDRVLKTVSGNYQNRPLFFVANGVEGSREVGRILTLSGTSPVGTVYTYSYLPGFREKKKRNVLELKKDGKTIASAFIKNDKFFDYYKKMERRKDKNSKIKEWNDKYYNLPIAWNDLNEGESFSYIYAADWPYIAWNFPEKSSRAYMAVLMEARRRNLEEDKEWLASLECDFWDKNWNGDCEKQEDYVPAVKEGGKLANLGYVLGGRR
tara:strand:- start:3395 stop:8518 length:5124 start_codon:yes stop_codon:yes gene_type:complete